MPAGVFNANVSYATTANLDVTVDDLCLEATATGALVLDTVAVVAGDVILVKDQTNPSENGVYDVIEPGDGSTEFKLKRNIKYLNLQNSSNVYVKLGSINTKTLWVLCFDEDPFTWGISSATFLNVEDLKIPELWVDEHIYVYRPGGTQERNVYTDWNDLMARVNAVEGPVIIQMDDEFVSPVVVPAGTYDMESVIIEGRVFTRAGGAENTDVDLADGCVFQNLGHMRYNLQVRSMSTSYIMNLEQGESSRLLLEENVQLIAANGVPFIHAMNNTRINMYDSQFRRSAVGGNEVVVEYDDPTNSSIRLFGRSRIRNNTIRTNVVLDLDIECFSTSATVGTQSQIMGGLVNILQNTADKESYDNSTSGLVAENVQDAIDEISSGGGVTGIAPTTVNAITRWADTSATTIKNSLAMVDDSGNITGENVHRGASNPNLSLPGEDSSDIYQRTSGTRPGLYVNNGSDRWLRLNSMSPIVFNPTDMVNTVDTPTLMTRNERSVLRFSDPTSTPSTQKIAIFQSAIPHNYSYQNIEVRIYFATTTATTGTIGFNLQFERIYPGNSSTTTMNTVPVNADTDLSIGTLIPEPDGSTTPGVISGEGEGYFTGNGTIPFSLDLLVPPSTAGDILRYQTSFSRTLRMNHVEPGDAFRLRLQRKHSGDTVADDVDVFMVHLVEEDP